MHFILLEGIQKRTRQFHGALKKMQKAVVSSTSMDKESKNARTASKKLNLARMDTNIRKGKRAQKNLDKHKKPKKVNPHDVAIKQISDYRKHLKDKKVNEKASSAYHKLDSEERRARREKKEAQHAAPRMWNTAAASGAIRRLGAATRKEKALAKAKESLKGKWSRGSFKSLFKKPLPVKPKVKRKMKVQVKI